MRYLKFFCLIFLSLVVTACNSDDKREKGISDFPKEDTIIQKKQKEDTTSFHPRISMDSLIQLEKSLTERIEKKQNEIDSLKNE